MTGKDKGVALPLRVTSKLSGAKWKRLSPDVSRCLIF